jgi:hypothetical protein
MGGRRPFKQRVRPGKLGASEHPGTPNDRRSSESLVWVVKGLQVSSDPCFSLGPRDDRQRVCSCAPESCRAALVPLAADPLAPFQPKIRWRHRIHITFRSSPSILFRLRPTCMILRLRILPFGYRRLDRPQKPAHARTAVTSILCVVVTWLFFSRF